MIAGGTTERLGYFAGYIHLIEEGARARDAFDAFGTSRAGTEDEVTRSPTTGYRFEFDDMRGSPTRLLDVAPYMEIFPDIPLGSLPTESLAPRGYPFTLPLQPAFRPPVPTPVPDVDDESGGGRTVIRPAPVLTVTYEAGGDDSIAQIRQANRLDDRDIVLVDPKAGIPDFQTMDATQAVAEILAETAAAVPSGLTLGEWSAEAFRELVTARNEAVAAENPDGLAASVENGLYIDGVLQPAGTTRPELSEIDALTGPEVRFGLSADTGGNNAVNAVSLVDVSGFRGGMIVLGDYHETNAIVQTNVLRDDDRVAWGGAREGAFGATERGGGSNVAQNIGEFADRAFNFTTDGFRVGLNWNVEVVRGDLYDVNMVRQNNFVSDGDVTVQSHFTSFYELRTGDNQSINLTDLLQSGDRYDLIVIGGSYREANLIFQTNILLDGDYLWSLSDGDGEMGHGFRAGHNGLRNDASITHLGNYDFRPLDGPASNLAAGIANESLDLATIRASGIPGNGSGTFNVLYIDGDYFNLNLISQINVIADMDTAIQFLRGADGATGTLSTGANQLLNAAAIVQVGSSSSYNYLGGERYEDSLLVQTNMVADRDEVIYGNADDLAPEIVAFLGEADPNADYYQAPVQTHTDNGDVMGGMLS